MRVHRKAGLVAAGLAALATAAGGVSAAQAAAPVPAQAPAAAGYVLEATSATGPLATFRLRNRATGRCLTAEWNDHVHAAPCDGRWSQDWFWVATSQGWHALKNDQTKRCLDGTRATGAVYAGGCNGGQYQNWSRNSGGQIIQHESTQRLDSNGAGSVYLSPPNNGDYQRWD
ncbi:RICIN domain-containing protein [Kribbella deserti]|uniref:Ricin-type beta-trefoil lectin domain protein n=1 Tax=Kribbella deserti TaxID=1926257 RepID=A0ABV6QGI5_9ACTN